MKNTKKILIWMVIAMLTTFLSACSIGGKDSSKDR
jgi:hypothetical protein